MKRPWLRGARLALIALLVALGGAAWAQADPEAERAAIRRARPAAAEEPRLPPADTAGGVTVRLWPRVPGATQVSFGVPLPPRAARGVDDLRISGPAGPLPAQVSELLLDYDKDGKRSGLRAVLVQLPGTVVAGGAVDVTVRWAAAGKAGDGKSDGKRPDEGARTAPSPATGSGRAPFRDGGISAESAEVIRTAPWSLGRRGAAAALLQGAESERRLFVGHEPRVLALFPAGYLAQSGILGRQITAAQAQSPGRAGLRFFSEALRDFTRSALYDEEYPLNPDPESVPDPQKNYEGWLYDRCATMLLAHTHTGEVRFLRAALRHCSYYAGQIRQRPPHLGIFAGKPDPDPKYSHLRGLYAYYALTGDEVALGAGRAIADMWLADESFVGPYRRGRTRGPESLWTERLLGTSLEGLLYGHRLSGDGRYLAAFREMLDTAHRHITADRAGLSRINPGVELPPQNCFIHSGLQQGERNAGDPWCSSWMSELLIDPLLRYQEQTGDRRVDEIFVRLARFLRDVGSNYFRGDPRGDSFMSPVVCDDPKDTENRRQLVPLYGAGVDRGGQRRTFGEWEDFLHCPDATALTAAALRGLKRLGGFDKNPVGPFPSEGASLLQLHHEFASCAERTFAGQTRLRRDPAKWTAAELSRGLAAPEKFIKDNRIGYPSRNVSPVRRLSWWFNTSLEQFSLLQDAGIEVRKLEPGRVPCVGRR